MTVEGVRKGLFYLVLVLNYVILISPAFSSDSFDRPPSRRYWITQFLASLLFIPVASNLAVAFGCVALVMISSLIFALWQTPLGNKTFEKATLPLRRRLRRSRNKHDKY